MNPAGQSAAFIFWISIALILYTYLLYPLLIAVAARLRSRPVGRRAGHQPMLTVLLAVHNEQEILAQRLQNLLEQDYPPERFDIVAVSDGSTDATAQILEQHGDKPQASSHPKIKSLILPQHAGKAAAINAGMTHATGELVVFADARQQFATDVLSRLAENFADPAVGSASGELVLSGGDGVAEQIGLYWRYEKWIRRNESATGSMLGATGAIYAIRRDLWEPLPPDTILDDFLTPMRIVLKGRRAVFDARAQADDRPSTRAGQEFRRKIRTLAGNYQALACEPALLAPWRNPSTWLRVWSHKLLRLLVPYALLALLASSLLAMGWIYRWAAWGQIFFYGLAALGWLIERLGRPVPLRLVRLAYTFVTLNAAAAGGLWCWLCGRRTRHIWRK